MATWNNSGINIELECLIITLWAARPCVWFTVVWLPVERISWSWQSRHCTQLLPSTASWGFCAGTPARRAHRLNAQIHFPSSPPLNSPSPSLALDACCFFFYYYFSSSLLFDFSVSSSASSLLLTGASVKMADCLFPPRLPPRCLRLCLWQKALSLLWAERSTWSRRKIDNLDPIHHQTITTGKVLLLMRTLGSP